MSEPLFVSALQLETWVAEGKVTFEGDVLTMGGESHTMVAAVRILSVIDGADQNNLVGQTLSVDQVSQQGWEHYQDSLIVGDTAYQCEEGFLDPHVPVAAPPSQQEVADANRKDEDDQDLLSDFLLKHM